ncbi:hypothetical protein HYY75_00540, partial [bacterium]|nr:hypothetical protein [bacterium]
MVRKFILGVFLSVSLFSVCYSADVSSIATSTRYDTNATGAARMGIMSIPANEIRRVPDMIENEKSQIGMWVPMIEPEPVVRGFDNKIQDNVEVFKNTGSTKQDFPYLIKVVKARSGHPEDIVGKWYVYKNVEYKWVFEDGDDKAEGGAGGKNGTSGGKVYSPFYKASGEEKSVEYAREIAKGADQKVWDPKVYANNHKKPFDSGIAGDTDTKGSTVLQEVGMLLSYERAEVSPSSSDSKGYTNSDA